MYIIDRNLEPLEQCREGAVTISTFYMTAAAGPSPSESESKIKSKSKSKSKNTSTSTITSAMH